MKRFWVMLASLGLVLAIGCSSKNYDFRLARTLESMKYQKKLDDNLIPAIATGKLKELDIYLRPPKALVGPTKAFQLAVVEPGKFDIENSFIDEKTKQSLHVLARRKKPNPTAKKGAPPAPPRGDFNTEVLELVKNVYGIQDLPITKFKEETKKKNIFKHHTIDLDPKTLQVYLYGAKGNPYEVALIFEYPKSGPVHSALNPKIGYCLESFAVDERAKRAFNGATTEEELEESGDDAGGAAAPF